MSAPNEPEAPALPETSCTVCHTPVGRDIPRCPNCGLSHPTRVIERGGLWAAALVLSLAWLLALALIAGAR
jgi:hypothetical protein